MVNDPDWKTAALLALAIWSFCRFYYFAFYVIEKYVDPGYKFSGLISFLKNTCSGGGANGFVKPLRGG